MGKHKNYWLIACMFVIGIISAVIVYFLSSQWVKADKKITFQANAQNVVYDIENELHDFANVIFSIGDFIQYSPEITHTQFQQFTRSQLQRNPSVLLFSWNPYVLFEQRDAFVEENRKQLESNYNIQQVNAQGQLSADIDRGYYFPVKYFEPSKQYPFLQGLNFTSNKQINAAIKKALNSGQLVVTDQLSLKIKDYNFSGMLLFWPIYDVFNGASPLNRKGVAVEVIDLNVFTERMRSSANSNNFDLYIFENSEQKSEHLVYSSAQVAYSLQALNNIAQRDDTYYWHSKLSFADRQWEAIIVPKNIKQLLPIFGLPWGIFIFVLIAISVVCYYWLKRHHYTLERVIRADQHSIANEKLAQEIIERLRAEEKLVKFAHAFQLSADGINLLDMDGNYTYCNQASLALYGYSSVDMYSLHYHDINLAPEVKELDLLELVTQQGSWQGELSQTCASGLKFSASVSLSLIKDDADNHIGYLEVTRDITETNLLEAELQQSRKMEALGTLAGGIAHDFNNILASILGNSEMMLMTKFEPSKAHAYTEKIQESCERAARLVKQIMTFSRMDTVQLTQIDLSKVIREEVEVIRSNLPSNIHLITNISNDCPPIEGDLAQIHQILLNLCTNASQAIGDKGGTIAIDLVPETVQAINNKAIMADRLKLTITDTGPGIEPKVIDKIFDPFFTTKKVGEGTGLGLSVVKSSVESHGGEVSVESNVDQGTTFVITLPTGVNGQNKPKDIHIEQEKNVIASEKSEDDVEENNDISLPVDLGSELQAANKKHVLIVEDEPHISRLYQEFIEDYGYRTTVCEDGRQALDVFNNENTKIDLVLTDQSMPHVTGKELSIVLLNRQPDLPIIMCTGYSEVISEELAYKIGIKHYFLKPASLGKLMSVIDEMLKD